MITLIKVSYQQILQHITAEKGYGNCGQCAEIEIARDAGQAGSRISTDHHLCTMGQKNKIHDAEYQSQTGSDQKQHYTGLQSVKYLLKQKRKGHGSTHRVTTGTH